jgi:predicted glycosyltransferase
MKRRRRARLLRRSPDARLIVSMAGGGADGYQLFRTLIEAMPDILANEPCHAVMITGPFLPAQQRRDLADRAKNLPVTLLPSVSDSVSYLAAADLVVAMAGYNTTAEILSVGTPALLVPRSGPSAEQQMRAGLFAERGWLGMLPADELDPTELARAVLRSLDQPPQALHGRAPSLDGRTAGMRALLDAFHVARSRHSGAFFQEADVDLTAERIVPA